MYTLDVKGDIVNLTDKDIELRWNTEWNEYECKIVALGPVGGFWQHEEMDIRSEYCLHQGTEGECLAFRDGLGLLLDVQNIPTKVPSTPKSPAKEQRGGTSAAPDTMPF